MNDKALTTQKNAPSELFTFNPEQVELIKNTVAKGATDEELRMFLYQSQRTGLDPLARQIYFTKRKVWNKAKNGYDERVTIQTSIDGFRVVAERSGDYSGQDKPVFEEKEGEKHPTSCTLSIYKLDRVGNRVPVTVTAYWDEYYPGDAQGFMWNKMPHTMLAKVAEALALRKAFPQDLSGIYSQEEMDQAQPNQTPPPTPKQQEMATAIHESGNPEPLPWEDEDTDKIEDDGKTPLTPQQMAYKLENSGKEESKDPEWITGKPVAEAEQVEEKPQEDLATDPQRKMFFALAAELQVSPEIMKERVKAKYELVSFQDITKKQISEAIDQLNETLQNRRRALEKEKMMNEPATSTQKMAVSQRISRGELDFPHSEVFKLTYGRAEELLAQ